MHFSFQHNIKRLYRYFDLIYMKWTTRYVNNDVISEENKYLIPWQIDIVRKKNCSKEIYNCCTLYTGSRAGADPRFQVRGTYLKKNRGERSEARKFVGVFRVKNPDFTRTNNIFSNFHTLSRQIWSLYKGSNVHFIEIEIPVIQR